MPERFQLQMTKIENDLLAEIKREYRQIRLRILDTLERIGASDPTVMERIRLILLDLSSRLADVVNSFIDRIRSAIETYARRQFEDLGLEGFDFDLLWAETAAERESILSSLIDRLRDAVSVIELRLRSALTQMQQAGDDNQAIALRLTALQPADGRVSEWRHGRNLLSSETQRALWGTVLAGVMTVFLLLADRLRQRGDGLKMFKTAIATLDKRTTQTCIRVDGQFQLITKPFELIGTPRYANKKMLPPFHDFCRTVIKIGLGRRQPFDMRSGEPFEVREEAG